MALVFYEGKSTQLRVVDYSLVERRGVWGYPPPGNFEKMGYLRQHFVQFEDSLKRNKAGKSEGH